MMSPRAGVASTGNQFLCLNHIENDGEKIDCCSIPGQTTRMMVRPPSRNKKSKTTSSTSIDKPGDMDVLCGRGRGYFEHPGNRRMLSIIALFKSEYQTASKVEKSTITQRVLQIVLDPTTNGARPRFLKKADSSSSAAGGKKKKAGSDSASRGAWQELCEQEVHKKVAHTLREQKVIVTLSKSANCIREKKNKNSSWHREEPRHQGTDDDNVVVSSEEEDEGTDEQLPDEETHHTTTPDFVRLVSNDSFRKGVKKNKDDVGRSRVDFAAALDLVESIDHDDFLFNNGDEINDASSDHENPTGPQTPPKTSLSSSSCSHGHQQHQLHEKYVLSSSRDEEEQQPLSFQEEPVFNEKEMNTLLHTVLDEEEEEVPEPDEDDISLDSFLEDLKLYNNSFRASFSTVTAAVV